MKQSNLGKNLSWNTLGMILYNFALWVFSALILRMLGSEMSGYYAIALSLGNTLYAVSLWGMRAYIVSDTNEQFTYVEYLYVRLCAILVSFVILLGIVFFGGYSSQQIWILIWYTAFKLAEAIIELVDSFCQQRMQMEINAKSMVLRGLLYTILFYLVLRFTKRLSLAFAILVICSLGIVSFYNWPRAKRLLPTQNRAVQFDHLVQIAKDCFPIMVFELLAAAVVAIPRLFYERIGDLSSLGIYTSIYTMVVFLQLVINILIYTFAPYMAKAYDAHNKDQFKKYLGMLVGGSLAIGILAEGMVVLLGKPVMTLLFGAEGGNHYSYLYLGIVSGVSLALTWILSQVFVIVKKNYGQLVCSLVATIACIIFSKQLVRADNCNSMTLVLILTNLVFIGMALLILYIKPNHKNTHA